MSKPARMIILCEDQQHACFVRRFLMERGFDRRDIYVKLSPPGQGSAEQWVRGQFPGELRAYRSRNARPPNGLIVVLDADIQEVSDRSNALDAECKTQGVDHRTAEEAVLAVIPKRNIETWLAYLRGETVDETTLCRPYPNPRDCQADVDRLDAMCRRGNLTENPPPSLVQCCEDFRRFWPLVE